VAYECLAGSQPFAGGALDVAIAHRDRPLPPLPVSVPAEVAAFVMTLTAKDPAWRPASAGEAADQAGRLRDDLLSQEHRARAVPSVTRAGPPPTIADDVRSRPRRRRPLAVAALTLVALTCLVLISVTGFASGSHPAGSPSRAPSQAAPAVTASPSKTASPSGTASPSATPSASTSVQPHVGTSSPGRTTDTATAPPGQRHHKKGHGNGNGNGNSQ
jgi:serine/threonine-protein kinase